MTRTLLRVGSLVFALLASTCGSGGGNVTLIEAAACSGSFSACGGDPNGTWEIASVCVEGDLVAALDSQLRDQDPACAGTVKSATVAGGGKVTYASGKAKYDAAVQSVSSMVFTSACFSALNGGGALNATTCSQYQATLDGKPDTNASCSYEGTTCNCALTETHQLRKTNMFFATGPNISESDGSNYEFCVNGSSMTQREEVAGTAYMVTQLAKR